MPRMPYSNKCRYICLICDISSRDCDNDLKFFTFPRNPDTKKVWIKFCTLLGVLRENDTTESCRICSRHFHPSCMVVNNNGKGRLRAGSVPTIHKRDFEEIPDFYLDEKLKQLEKFQAEQMKLEEENKSNLTKENSRSTASVKPRAKHALIDHDYVSKKSLDLYIRKCRICLSDEAENNLFTFNIQNDPMDHVYRDLFSVDLEPSDRLPSNICLPCMQTLDLFYTYKKRVLASEIELHNLKLEEEVQKQVEGEKTSKRSRNRARFNRVLCEECGCFIYEHHLERHRITSPRHISGPLRKIKQCDECGKIISGSMTQHKFTHKDSNSMPFVCELCGKGFWWRRTLLIHINVHKNVRPYKCNECARAYTSNSSLWFHRQTVHLGKKLYKERNVVDIHCPYCGKFYTKKSSMFQHIRRSHNTKKQLHTASEAKSMVKPRVKVCKMKRHNQLHINHNCYDGFVCNTCDKKFSKRKGLLMHMKTHKSVKSMVGSEKDEQLNTQHSEKECLVVEDGNHLDTNIVNDEQDFEVVHE